MARNHLQHLAALLVCGLSLCAGGSVQAAGLAPSGVFVQAGFGDQDTHAYLAGVTWTVPLQYECGIGWVGAFIEGALGRWHTEGREENTAWPTQISATPTLRFHPSRMPFWFAELGVGANYIVPLFRSGHKRFSTEFNCECHELVSL